jgi:phage gp29-like protein
MMSPTDIAKHYGDGLKKDTVRMHYQRHIAPYVKAIATAVAEGKDPHQVVDISEDGRKCQNELQVLPFQQSTISFIQRTALMISPTETARHFGGGLKGGALRERIRRDINPFVQPMVDAVKTGKDPLETVLISDSGKGQICFSDVAQHNIPA